MPHLSCPRDTTDDAWSYFLACHRQKTGTGRIRDALETSLATRRLLRTGATGADNGQERQVVSLKTLEELFRYVVSGLDSAGVPFMVVGSFASTYHGVPRATQDLDLVCDLQPSNFQSFVEVFSDVAFYFSPESAKTALEERGMFNLIHPQSGWKIDIIVKKQRSFSQREFQRRVTAELFGKKVSLASAEDTILSKLEWAKDSFSERQLRDVAEILDSQQGKLDEIYLQQGIAELGLQEVFKRVKGPW